jgi:predicted metal-dependent RNase
MFDTSADVLVPMSTVTLCRTLKATMPCCAYVWQVCEGVEVTAFYAGHVLGAAMLHVKAGSESLVYTGQEYHPGCSIQQLQALAVGCTVQLAATRP